MKKRQVSTDAGKTWIEVKPMRAEDMSMGSEPEEPIIVYSDAPRVMREDGSSPFVPGMYEITRRWQNLNCLDSSIGGDGPDYTLRVHIKGEWVVVLRGSLASLDRQLTGLEVLR